MFYGKSSPRRSESCLIFTASFFFAGRHRFRFSRQLCSSQAGGVFVFHGESLRRRSESSSCFTASLFLAGRSRLRCSWRVSSSQVGVVFMFHGETFPRKSLFVCVFLVWFTARLFLGQIFSLALFCLLCLVSVNERGDKGTEIIKEN